MVSLVRVDEGALLCNSSNAGDEDRQRHIRPDIWKFQWQWERTPARRAVVR